MKLGEIRAQVPGLPKRFVHYLESQGYIQPVKVKKQRISRRDYTDEDLHTIKGAWEYYERGFSVQSAVELLRRAHRDQVYLLSKVPAGKLGQAQEVLRNYDRVVEVTAVYGEDVDLIARMHAPDEGDIYMVLAGAVRQEVVESPPRVMRIKQMELGQDARPVKNRGRRVGLRAYILIKVPAKKIDGIVEQLKQFAGVIETSVIYGETDIVAHALVEHQDELDDLIMNKIQTLPAVESTRTFIAVGGTHWRREESASTKTD